MSTVRCQYNMYINESHCLDHFPICQEANGVSKESTTCADNNTTLYTAENCMHKHLLYWVVKDICDNWMVSFCKVFGQGWVFMFFLYSNWGWIKQFWLYYGWISKKFTKKNISLWCQPLAINYNDRPLTPYQLLYFLIWERIHFGVSVRVNVRD
jgi:hypothetical protein